MYMLFSQGRRAGLRASHFDRPTVSYNLSFPYENLRPWAIFRTLLQAKFYRSIAYCMCGLLLYVFHGGLILSIWREILRTADAYHRGSNLALIPRQKTMSA